LLHAAIAQCPLANAFLVNFERELAESDQARSPKYDCSKMRIPPATESFCTRDHATWAIWRAGRQVWDGRQPFWIAGNAFSGSMGNRQYHIANTGDPGRSRKESSEWRAHCPRASALVAASTHWPGKQSQGHFSVVQWLKFVNGPLLLVIPPIASGQAE
jgi:hypothetical protein